VAGYHSLYQWYNSKEGQHFPDPTGLKARIEYWSFGLYPACIKYLMAAFDVPEVCTHVNPFDVPEGLYTSQCFWSHVWRMYTFESLSPSKASLFFFQASARHELSTWHWVLTHFIVL
jgi:hypothetical protein